MGMFVHVSTKSTVEPQRKSYKVNRIKSKNHRIFSGESKQLSTVTENLNKELYKKVDNKLIQILERKVTLLNAKIDK